MSVDHNNRDLGSAIVDRNSMIFAGKLKIPKNSILRPKKVPKTSRYKGGWQKIFFYYFSLCNFTPFQKFVGKTSKLGACCMRKTLIQGRFCRIPLRTRMASGSLKSSEDGPSLWLKLVKEHLGKCHHLRKTHKYKLQQRRYKIWIPIKILWRSRIFGW